MVGRDFLNRSLAIQQPTIRHKPSYEIIIPWLYYSKYLGTWNALLPPASPDKETRIFVLIFVNDLGGKSETNHDI
jgi:hypothetical protein